MTIASLSEVLQEAKKNNYAVAGLVVLGWEDARCYAETAEELKVPVICLLYTSPSPRDDL